MTSFISGTHLTTQKLTQDQPRTIITLDGIPETRISLISITESGTFQTKKATLALHSHSHHISTSQAQLKNLYENFTNKLIEIFDYLILDDKTIKKTRLMQGFIDVNSITQDHSKQQFTITLIDRWQKRLNQPLTQYFKQNNQLALSTKIEKQIKIGQHKNRSAHKSIVNNQSIYTFTQSSPKDWRLLDAIQAIGALANITFNTQAIPSFWKYQPLTKSLNLDDTLETSLTQLLSPIGLIATPNSHLPITTSQIFIRPRTDGNRHTIQSHIDLKSKTRPQKSLLYIAQASPQIVESTFILTPDWLTQLQGHTNESYTKTGNENFETYQNVYRRWVFNNFNYIYTLFTQPTPHTQNYKFGKCLCLNENNTRLDKIIEYSDDNGSTWKHYGQPHHNLTDTLGIYLDPSTLDVNFLNAMQNGVGKLRITASLTNIKRTQIKKWEGNPFYGTGDPIYFDSNDAFQFKQIHPDSQFYNQINSEIKPADQQDDTHQLNNFLQQQIQLHKSTSDKITAQTITLPGTFPYIKIGDQLNHKIITSIKTQWLPTPTTQIQLIP